LYILLSIFAGKPHTLPGVYRAGKPPNKTEHEPRPYHWGTRGKNSIQIVNQVQDAALWNNCFKHLHNGAFEGERLFAIVLI
jgi:hypothetical protein